MQYTSTILAAAGLITSVAAHGSISQPPPRAAGENYRSICGEQLYNNQASDRNGNVQGVLEIARTQTDVTPECNVWLCKGFTAADNTANVQSYTAGQVVPITFDLAAPHEGAANVSIVHTASNTIIGSALKSWDVFASPATPITSAETSFSITIPSDLGSQCATAGDCVIQHFWDARAVDQTYESCIDFTVGGSGAGTPPADSPPATTPAATPATTAPADNPPATTPPAVPAVPATNPPAVNPPAVNPPAVNPPAVIPPAITPPAVPAVPATTPSAAPTTLQTSTYGAAPPAVVTPNGSDLYDCED